MIPIRSLPVQTVLLTGATGFLGSHLASAFLSGGHKVAILKRAGSRLSRIQPLLPDLHVFNVEEGLEIPFQTLGRVDAVVHTATCYGRKGENASEIVEANTAFPLRLLEVATFFNTDTFLNTDSFFNTGTVLYKYLNAYSLSKRHFMEWGKSVAESGKVRFFNLKLEHMYGAGDDPGKFATHIIRACLSNADALNLTPGEQRRDFVHIDDIVSSYLKLLENTMRFDHGFFEFGVGTGHGVTIRVFTNTVHRLTGSQTKLLFGALPYRDQEIMESKADVTALKALGWTCRYDLESGLKQVVEAERNRL